MKNLWPTRKEGPDLQIFKYETPPSAVRMSLQSGELRDYSGTPTPRWRLVRICACVLTDVCPFGRVIGDHRKLE